jgi:uncharacterized iron-regulated membrane protein
LNSTRAIFRIHSWLGLLTGAFMLVIVLSGVYLVYRAELDRWFNPEIRVRPVAAHPVAIDAVLRAARIVFPAYRVSYVMFPGNDWSPYTVYLREVAPGGDVVRHQVYVDAGTGRIVAHRLSYHFLTDWMVRIHDNLWLSPYWGDPLVAVLGILLTASGLTGLWVYRHKLWDALRFRTTAQRIGRAHAHLGIWSLLFSVLIGITGTVLNYGSLPVFFHRAPPVPLQGSDWALLDRLPSMDALVAASRRAFPDLQARYIYFPLSGPNETRGDAIKVAGRATEADLLGASSFVTFSLSPAPHVTSVFDARRAPLGRRLVFMSASLHYGDYWGHASKIPYVILGLVLAFLAASGLWIRLRPRRSAGPARPAGAVAAK